MMIKQLIVSAAATAALAVATPAASKEYTFSYQGTVTAAENFSDPDLPDLPTFGAHVGELVKGSFSFDTDNLGSFDEFVSTIPLDTIFFSLPAEAYTEDFEGPGGQLFYDGLTGETSITGGRADFGRQFTLDLLLSPSQTFDPGSLNGKTGPFTFVDYAPNGFRVSGFLTVGAVPEASTWALMIAGFGFVGASARRRRTEESAAVA